MRQALPPQCLGDRHKPLPAVCSPFLSPARSSHLTPRAAQRSSFPCGAGRRLLHTIATADEAIIPNRLSLPCHWISRPWMLGAPVPYYINSICRPRLTDATRFASHINLKNSFPRLTAVGFLEPRLSAISTQELPSPTAPRSFRVDLAGFVGFMPSPAFWPLIRKLSLSQRADIGRKAYSKFFCLAQSSHTM